MFNYSTQSKSKLSKLIFSCVIALSIQAHASNHELFSAEEAATYLKSISPVTNRFDEAVSLDGVDIEEAMEISTTSMVAGAGYFLDTARFTDALDQKGQNNEKTRNVAARLRDALMTTQPEDLNPADIYLDSQPKTLKTVLNAIIDVHFDMSLEVHDQQIAAVAITKQRFIRFKKSF